MKKEQLIDYILENTNQYTRRFLERMPDNELLAAADEIAVMIAEAMVEGVFDE